jgi:hypothetical protein
MRAYSVFIKTVAIQGHAFFAAKERKDRIRLWVGSSFSVFYAFLRGYGFI